MRAWRATISGTLYAPLQQLSLPSYIPTSRWGIVLFRLPSYYGVSTKAPVFVRIRNKLCLCGALCSSSWIVFPSPSLYLSLIFQQETPSTSEDILGGPTMISGAKTFKFRGGGGRGRRPSPPQGELPPSHGIMGGRKKEEGTLTEQIRAR